MAQKAQGSTHSLLNFYNTTLFRHKKTITYLQNSVKEKTTVNIFAMYRRVRAHFTFLTRIRMGSYCLKRDVVFALMSYLSYIVLR
jgi:hypothetical protein